MAPKPTKKPQPRWLERVVQHVHANYNSPLTVKQLAGVAQYSQYHFSRMFARHMGMTPIRYVSEVRYQRAAKLLRTSKLNVLEICRKVGLESVGAFSSAFKRRFGQSPVDYRRENGRYQYERETSDSYE